MGGTASNRVRAESEPVVHGCQAVDPLWPTCLFLDLTEHAEESSLHPMAIQRALSEREGTEERVRKRSVALPARVKTLCSEPASPVGHLS